MGNKHIFAKWFDCEESRTGYDEADNCIIYRKVTIKVNFLGLVAGEEFDSVYYYVDKERLVFQRGNKSRMIAKCEIDLYNLS